MPRANQKSGPLAGHVRAGRVFKSPLAATGLLYVKDWARDDLPDLIWPVLVTSELGSSAARTFIQWQKRVQDELQGVGDIGKIADCLDGRLTSLDRLKLLASDADAIVSGYATELGLLSEPVLRVLSAYPDRPAAWLTHGRQVVPPEQEDLEFLAKAMLEVLQDSHREALIKCFGIWSSVQARTFRSDAPTIELLKHYPTDPETRDLADTSIRAIWNARKGAVTIQDPEFFAKSLEWAKVFWGANSMTSQCVRNRTGVAGGEPDASAAGTSSPVEHAEPSVIPEGGAHLRRLAMDLLVSYVEALETAPSDLYEHEVQEVQSGLVVRAGRDVITALGVPDLWCLEHGSHIIRVLVESRILVQWMATQDTSIYKTYQDYGAGKAKLYAQIMDELPEDARKPDFVEAMKEIERLSYNTILDHRVVDTRDSFAQGKSIRTMADEADLLDFYRQAYQIASGVSHSEWWSIETHAMERCLNVLHGGHLIPSLMLNGGGNVQLACSWVDQLYTLIRSSLDVLGTSQAAIAAAFEWLDDQPSKGGDENGS